MVLAFRIRLAARVALLAAALGAAQGARADSMRCEGGIVSTGDAKIDLLGKCGPPALADGAARAGRAVEGLTAGQHLTAWVELWTYDLGRDRFVHLVRIEKGRITAIERGSYGYADRQPVPQRPRRAACDAAALVEGKLELDVLATCGEPAVIDAWEEEVLPRGEEGAATGGPTIQRLTYDFGPNQLVRFVRIEGGRVTRVETGSYGYAR